MNKTTMMKGLGAAMAVGGTIAAVGASMTGKSAAKRKMKKTAAKAIRTMDTLLDGTDRKAKEEKRGLSHK